MMRENAEFVEEIEGVDGVGSVPRTRPKAMLYKLFVVRPASMIVDGTTAVADLDVVNTAVVDYNHRPWVSGSVETRFSSMTKVQDEPEIVRCAPRPERLSL